MRFDLVCRRPAVVHDDRVGISRFGGSYGGGRLTSEGEVPANTGSRIDADIARATPMRPPETR